MHLALSFLLLLGLVSLLSDITYEGARGIVGPYLALLGASAPIVGIISGLGEFIGYGLRLLSGTLVDKLRAYWGFLYLGYAINLLAVPALGLVNNWELAGILILMERAGKAIRTPARDTLLSFASVHLGSGKGFGIHEALDQIGAILGPSIVAAILALRGSYKEAFYFLLIPALLALTTLFLAKKFYPNPLELKIRPKGLRDKKFPKVFWLYTLALSLIGAGFVDFPLIGYHFKKIDSLSQELIPFFYALAMGIDAISALILGYFFDRKGFVIIFWPLIVSLFAIPLLFLSKGIVSLLMGILFWGIGLGTQESIARAIVAEILPKEVRGSGFGIYSAFFGFFWFIGSSLLGFVYNLSLLLFILISLLFQILSIPLLFKVKIEFEAKNS